MLKRSRRDGKNTQKILYKNILMSSIPAMVWLVIQSQTFWSAKAGGP